MVSLWVFGSTLWMADSLPPAETTCDAIGDIAAVAAATGVFDTGAAWTDIIVAIILSGLDDSAVGSSSTPALSS